MSGGRHSDQDTTTGIHVIQHWSVASAAARQALSVASTDVGRVARQTDNATFWILTGTNAAVDWVQLGQVGGTAPADSQYLVLVADSTLTQERILTMGSGLASTNAGAGGAFTVAADGTVARVSGSHFSGNISVAGTGTFGQLTGSMTRLTDGRSFIAAGANITVDSSSNGQIIITGQAGGGGGGSGDPGAAYVVLNATGSLTNERVLTASNGIALVDGGANGAVTLSVDGTVARVSGSHFSGNISVAGTGTFATGISGSHHHLANGTSAFIAGTNVTITSASNGAVTISSTDTNTTYTAGSGLALVGTTFSADGTVARVSGSHFANISVSGSGSFSLGMSGSHHHLTNGTSAFAAGTNVTIISASNGQVTISSTDTTYTAGSGLALVGTTFSADGTVARVSGSHFSGNISVAGTGTFGTGLTGSLTRLTDGRSFIAAGSNITVDSSSNGQVVIASTGGGGAPTTAQYLVLTADATLSAERTLILTGGLTGSDAGANGNFTVSAVPETDQFILAMQIFS